MKNEKNGMKENTYDHSRTLKMLVLISLGFGLLIEEAYADQFEDSKTSFNAYRERAIQFQRSAMSKYLTAEYNELTQWIGEAERLLREEEEDDFIRAVQLVRVQLRLVEISMEELSAREQIQNLATEASRAENKAKEEREKVVELERAMGGSLSGPKTATPSSPSPSMAPIPSSPIVTPAANPQVAPTSAGGTL